MILAVAERKIRAEEELRDGDELCDRGHRERMRGLRRVVIEALQIGEHALGHARRQRRIALRVPRSRMKGMVPPAWEKMKRISGKRCAAPENKSRAMARLVSAVNSMTESS